MYTCVYVSTYMYMCMCMEGGWMEGRKKRKNGKMEMKKETKT